MKRNLNELKHAIRAASWDLESLMLDHDLGFVDDDTFAIESELLRAELATYQAEMNTLMPRPTQRENVG